MPAPRRVDALARGRVFALVVCAFSALVSACCAGEVLQDPDAWHCYGCRCEPHSSDHSLQVSHRVHNTDGPSLAFEVRHNYMYSVQVYVKIINDISGKLGQELDIVITIPEGGRNHYVTVAQHPVGRVADGWILLQGAFKVSSQVSGQGHLKVQGPDPMVQFSVKGASVSNIWQGSGWRPNTDSVINDVRQSDVILNVTTTGNTNHNEIEIQLVQKSKAFPVGTVVNSWTYNSADNWRYRDYIHDHFNWAVLESSLKWVHVEASRGHHNFHLPLSVVDSLRGKGLKIRGHNLVWSIEGQVPEWVRQLSGNDLRKAVRDHITVTLNRTRGRLEHWDASNENLHGQWFQERMQDFSWEQTPFLEAHAADPHVKLFLNDFNIVAHGTSTRAYIEQAQRLQRAGVGLYGLGVQCHFWNEEEPDPYLIKDRLDKLAKTGLPIWVTEFNVVAANEDRRADYLETAMRAFYGHPAVEGILIWGFWDRAHSRGPHAALVKGGSLQPTSAGRRFLDLWERQWMTDHTQVLSETGSTVTVRAFHGEYQMHVRYQGKELDNLRQNFTLGKDSHTVNVHVQV